MKKIFHALPLERDVEEAFQQIEDQLNSNFDFTGVFLVNNIEINTKTFSDVFDQDTNYDERIVRIENIGTITTGDEIPYDSTSPRTSIQKLTSELTPFSGETDIQIKALVNGGFQIFNLNSASIFPRLTIQILRGGGGAGGQGAIGGGFGENPFPPEV